MTSTTPRPVGSRSPTGPTDDALRLAEVIQLHTATVPDPADRPDESAGGDQLALRLFFLIDGEGGGG